MLNDNRETHISNYLNRKQTNGPTKRHGLAERIQTQDPYICCLQETHSPQTQGRIWIESEGMEEGTPCKWNQKKAAVAILIADKTDFKIKTVVRFNNNKNTT